MVLDTYGLVYRAFFRIAVFDDAGAGPYRSTPAYGFAMMPQQIDRRRAADARDRPRSTRECPPSASRSIRNTRRNGETMPEDLRGQFALVSADPGNARHSGCGDGRPGADDVIATLRAPGRGDRGETVVVTGDLDLLQIADEHTTIPDDQARHHRTGPLRSGRGVRAVRTAAVAASPTIAASRAIRRTTFPAFRAWARRPRSNDQIGRIARRALLPIRRSRDRRSLKGLVERFGAQAQVCRDVSVVPARPPRSARLGRKPLQKRPATTRSMRSTATSNSRRCWPNSPFRSTHRFLKKRGRSAASTRRFPPPSIRRSSNAWGGARAARVVGIARVGGFATTSSASAARRGPASRFRSPHSRTKPCARVGARARRGAGIVAYDAKNVSARYARAVSPPVRTPTIR